jgi:hypothetical protein
MRAREGCGYLAFGFLFVVVACLVFVGLAGAMILSGEVSLHPPRLTAFEPEPGYPFRPTTPITLTFDQMMDPGSVEAALVFVPAVRGTFSWNEDRTQVTFVPSPPGYEPDTAYTVRLPAGIQAGTLPRKTERGKEWGFFLPPLLDSAAPALDERDLGAWVRLEARFNYALDCDLTLATFAITPETAGVLACGGKALTFSPTQPLEPGTAYVANLAHVILEDDPSARPGVRWAFSTASPLTIVDLLPGADVAVVDLWTPFRVTLNRPVVAESLLSRLSLTAWDGSALAGQVTWEEDGAAFVFQPEEPLEPDSEYQLVLREGVQDELGFALAETVAHSVQTMQMVGMPLPIPGDRDVALDSAIRIPFTRPMDRASVEAGLVFTPTVEGAVTWEEDTLVFVPRGGLAAETVYEVALSPDVRDASGAPLSMPVRTTFETQEFLVDARVPADAILMGLQQPIEFTFALPMNPASVEAALILSPTTPGDAVWSDDGRAVTFQPAPAWLAGAEYQVTLSGRARTADGTQTLGVDRTWHFSTGVTQVRFGEGPNVQVMDTAGARAFQFTVQGADVADFWLYAITPTQFLDLYSSGFRGIGPQEPHIVDTAGLSPTVSWREAVAPSEEWPGDGGWRTAEAHVPSAVPLGLYVLAAEPQAEEQGQLLLVLSRHALVLKRALAGGGGSGTAAASRAQVVAWDTEISGGTPVVSSTVRLYDRDGTFLTEGQTDAEGLVALDMPGDPSPLVALAEKGGDVTVCGLGIEWSETGWLWWSEPPSRPLYTIYSYTDRPIYRPGQTVYSKDFVRADDGVSYTLPGPEIPVTVRLRDARDNVAATQAITATRFGTLHGAFPLAQGAMLGTWNLETEVEGTVTRQPFKVEEYRKPDYQLTVETPQSAYVRGEAITVTMGAAYYSGQPVAGAEVLLRVFPSYPGETYEHEATRFGYPISSEVGRMDDDGRWTLVLPTDDLFSERDQDGRAMLALEATVTDDTGQSVSNSQMVIVHRTPLGLNILLEKQGYRPDEPIPFGVLVRDLKGQPVADAELEATILGWDERVVASASAATDASGQARFSVTLAEQGRYRLTVTSTDPLAAGGTDAGSQTIGAEEWLWVYDPTGQASWYQGRWGSEDDLSVSADRTSYAVGEAVQLVVYTPVPGPALLTFERGQTHYAEPITLVSGTNLISVPVRVEYAPNIHVTVNQFGPPGADWWPEQSWPEAELHTASTQLLVPMTDRLLTVTLTSDAATYVPGEEATFHVRVTDHQDVPVVAEVSLAVVDEAIYALSEDLSESPFEVFYGPRPNLVHTFDSLRPFRWLYPEGGLGGGDERGVGGAPRREFLDTAYWAPTVVTDENGQATFTFELPDNLTEWRAVARAITTDTLVGQATAHVVVSQDIVVRPALPRFLVEGDAITLTAVVQNFTDRAVSATVQLDVDGLVLTEEEGEGKATERIVAVPAGGSALAGWPVVAEQGADGYAEVGPTEARIRFQATATYGGARVAGRDAVELLLPVYPLAAQETTAFAGMLTPARPTDTLTITLPADRLEINMASSIAPGLLDGLDYLLDYPFG